MNLLERVLTLLGANLNSMVEKADDPEKVLRQLQLDMRNQLVQVKTQVATTIAESHKLQKRSKEQAAEADLWLKKAEQAIQQNNDDAARKALARYNDVLKQAKRYQQLQKEQEQLVQTMRGALRQLEAKITEVETTIDLLLTRKRNALIQQRVYDTLSKTGGPKERERAARAQDAVMEAEARARALAQLHGQDITAQLDQLSDDQIIESQMSELRKKQKPARQTPLLQSGDTPPSPLIPPQPQSNAPVKQQVADNGDNRDNQAHKGPGPYANSDSTPTSPTTSKEEEIAQLKRLLD
nr:PspA/IM30 family protein [Ktedonobacteraceae bacterium]